MTKRTDQMRLSVRLHDRGGAMFGPGKADLLALIVETGSIAAAGRRLGMSYKRAWGLVEKLNEMFVGPLVECSRGGASFGGATLTPLGQEVLMLYRRIEADARSSTQTDMADLQALLTPPPEAADPGR